MKKILLLLLFSCPFGLIAQNNYPEAIQQGDKAFQKGDFQIAINKYFAAEAFDPSKKEVVKQKINEVFKRIEALRQEAEAARQKAQKAEQRATREANNARDAEKKAEKEAQKAQTERDIAQKTLAELRQKNEAIFTSFADLGIELIYTLEHEKALEKMAVAVDIEVDETLKKQTLQAPLEELLFFFAEGDRRPELARQAAELLLQLPVSAELQRGLNKLPARRMDRIELSLLLY